jgi:hypothetical protein
MDDPCTNHYGLSSDNRSAQAYGSSSIGIANRLLASIAAAEDRYVNLIVILQHLGTRRDCRRSELHLAAFVRSVALRDDQSRALNRRFAS